MIAFKPGHRGGFTLIELLIVVAVVLVMSGAAALSLPRFRADALLNAATELESVLSVTRETAIAMRVPLSVTFNITGNTGNSASYTKPGGQAAVLQFNGTIGYQTGVGYGNPAIVSFDAFGHPTAQGLPSGKDGSGSSYSYVPLETKGGGFIIQVLVHKNTGETEIKWIKR